MLDAVWCPLVRHGEIGDYQEAILAVARDVRSGRSLRSCDPGFDFDPDAVCPAADAIEETVITHWLVSDAPSELVIPEVLEILDETTFFAFLC